MKTVYTIELENGNFAKLTHEVGTHVHIEEVGDIAEATHFEVKKDAQHYFDDFNLFKKYGFGYELINNSVYQYHSKFSPFKTINTVQVSYQIIDEPVKELKTKQDLIYECYNSCMNFTATKEIIEEIEKKVIPNNIDLLAEQKGWNDDEIRETVYVLIRNAIAVGIIEL